MNADQEYIRVVRHVLGFGYRKPTRQGGSVLSSTALQYRTKMGVLTRGGNAVVRDFPLLKCKKVFARGAWEELAWFLRGSTNAGELSERGVFIWDDDVAKAKERGFDYKRGELGPVYGRQWRRCGPNSVDQIAGLIKGISKDPYGRRHIISAWNVAEIDQMVLPPCHYAAQWVCQPGEESMINVNCVVNMRSTDIGLGLPFNIASYAMLTILICLELDDRYQLGEIIVNMADAHIYGEHIEALRGIIQGPEPSSEPVMITIPAALQGTENFASAKKGMLKLITTQYTPTNAVKMELKT